MAALALTAALPAGASAGALFVAGVVGTYIDQTFLYPALFPPDPVVGQRINELQVQGVDEGHPQSRCYGPNNRVAGTIFWLSSLTETKTTEKVGGKGGSSTRLENFTYTTDLAVSWCEAPDAGIDAVVKIYGDVNVIYDSDPNVNLTGSDIEVADVIERFETRYLTEDTPGIEGTYDGPSWYRIHVRSDIYYEAPPDGTEISLVRPDHGTGNELTVTGFTETSYNGTFEVLSSTELSDRTNRVIVSAPITTVVGTEAAGNSITFSQTNRQFDPKKFTSVTHFLGTNVQAVSSLLEGVDGLGNVPAYRNRAYSVLEGYNLTDHGNRLPQLQAYIDGGSGDLQDVFDAILGFSDLDSSQWNTDALSGISTFGYTTRGPQPVISSLQPLMLAFDVIAQESNGVITFLQRSAAPTVSINFDQMQAHPFGEQAPYPHEVDAGEEETLPKTVTVKFVDADNELQPGSAKEVYGPAVTEEGQDNVEFNIVMNGGSARDIAARLVYGARINNVEHELRLPPSFFYLQENDVILYTYNGESYRFIAQQVDFGANGVVVVKGPRDLEANSTHNSPYEVPFGKRDANSLYVPPSLELIPIDVAPLRQEDVESPVVYYAVNDRGSGQTWPGGGIYESVDGGVNYGLLSNVDAPATTGVATSALPDRPGGQWDRGSELSVLIAGGSLESKSEIEVLNGANRLLVGREIIGFTTASLVADGLYTVSGLLRGLAGTEDARTQHIKGEDVVVLGDAITVVPRALSDSGLTTILQAVPTGGTVGDYIDVSETVQLNCLREPGPVHLYGTQDGGGDWTLGWTRRSRQTFRIFSQAAPELDDDTYNLELYSGTTRLTTIVGVSNPYTLTAAQQTTIYGSTQSSISMVVRQSSNYVGTGRASALTTVTAN